MIAGLDGDVAVLFAVGALLLTEAIVEIDDVRERSENLGAFAGLDGDVAVLSAVGTLLLMEAMVETDDVRARMVASGFTTVFSAVRGILPPALAGLLTVDVALLEVNAVLLTGETALLLLDALVVEEVVRNRDDPTSGDAGATEGAELGSYFMAGIKGWTTDLVAGPEDFGVRVVVTNFADSASELSSFGDGRVMSCLGGPLIDLGIVFANGVGLDGRCRPIETV